MARTKVRHPSLSSTTARGLLGHRQDVDEFTHLFATIDQLADLHDGLDAVRSNGDPLKTREQRAHEYRESYRRATERAQGLIDRSASRLSDLYARTLSDARARAGVSHPPAEAAEIRSALRQMGKEDREKAISDAMARGDAAVIASIREVSPVLVGSTTIPLDDMVQLFVEARVPELRGQVEEVNHALKNLELAAVAFRKTAAEMRDPRAEAEADDGVQAARQAEAKLGLALQVRGETE